MKLRIPAGTLMCLLLLGCGSAAEQQRAMGTLEVDRVELTSESSEPVTRIQVKEGDQVAAGDVLIIQDSTRFEVRQQQAEASLAIVKAELAAAETGPRFQTIAQARAQLAAAASATRIANIELQREQSLIEQDYASKNNVDVLKARYEEASARQQQSDAALAELVEGTRIENIDAARGRFAAAEADLEDSRISLQRATITAPQNGYIESILIEPGERPQPGRTIIVLLKDQTPYARVHIPEAIRARVVPGSRAEIYIDGIQQVLEGRVRWVAKDASFTPHFALTQHDRGHLSYLAEVDVVNEPPNIAMGVPVGVTFPEIDL